MDHEEFLIVRSLYTWNSYGISGTEEVKHILLKDIEDEHLDNIIIHVKENIGIYALTTLTIMEKEKEYRSILHRGDKIKKIIKKIYGNDN